MGLFDKLKNRSNKDFLQAVCAACALVAYADGEVTDDEVEKMMAYMGMNKSLKDFTSTEVSQAFQYFVGKIGFDFDIGKMDAFNAIKKIHVGSTHAKDLCAICIAVAKADGKFEKCEMKVIREICSRLGVRPSEFGL